MIGMYLYASGAQRQNFTVLSHLGISIGYSSLVRNEEVPENRITAEDGAAAELAVLSEPLSKSPASVLATVDSADISTNNSSHISDDHSETPAVLRPRKRRLGLLPLLSIVMRQKARTIASVGLYGEVYDNINFMNRTGEQIIGRHGMVTCFCTAIY